MLFLDWFFAKKGGNGDVGLSVRDIFALFYLTLLYIAYFC